MKDNSNTDTENQIAVNIMAGRIISEYFADNNEYKVGYTNEMLLQDLNDRVFSGFSSASFKKFCGSFDGWSGQKISDTLCQALTTCVLQTIKNDTADKEKLFKLDHDYPFIWKTDTTALQTFSDILNNFEQVDFIDNAMPNLALILNYNIVNPNDITLKLPQNIQNFADKYPAKAVAIAEKVILSWIRKDMANSLKILMLADKHPALYNAAVDATVQDIKEGAISVSQADFLCCQRHKISHPDNPLATGYAKINRAVYDSYVKAHPVTARVQALKCAYDNASKTKICTR